MKKINLFFISILFFMQSYAQNGMLCGTVSDELTGQSLIGANILISSLPGVGTISDLSGYYSLNLKPGKYDVSFSFISYETKVIREIEIKSGKKTTVNLSLSESNVELGEIVVSSEVLRKSESSILVMQKKASGVMNGVSMEQISKLGDGNAAAALKRVTGISVQGGKYVYVRGLGDRYTKNTLNSAEIPSLDPEKNSVQMDIFPSIIIQSITVLKSFTPDMSGESTGGQVNIITKDFPEELNFQWSSSFTYNPQSSFNKNFLSIDNSLNNWTAFNGRLGAIPSLAESTLNQMERDNIEQLSLVYYNADELGEISKSFNKNVFPKESRSFMNQSHSFSLGNKTKIFNKTFGYNFSINYSNRFDYYDDGIIAAYNDINASADKVLSDRKASQNSMISSFINLSYKLSENNKIGFRFIHNQNGESTAQYRTGHFYYEGPNVFVQERNLSYLQREFSSSQFNGKHILRNNVKINWLTSYTNMTQNEPDARFFTNLYESINGDTLYKIKTNTLPSRLYRNFKEYNFDNKLNIDIPILFISSDSKLKFGASYINKSRMATQHKFELRADNALYQGNQELDGGFNSFLDNTISVANPNGVYYSVDVNNDLINGYFAFQSIFSYYAMLDISLNNNWRIVAGSRIEHLKMQTENLINKNDAKHAIGDLLANDILPSLNISYRITNNMNLRLAYSKTLARPTFREFSPQSFYDYKMGLRINGNPELKESRVENFDLRYEYFFNRGELFALSSFYKRFINPLEMRLNPSVQNFEIMYVNGNQSVLFGFEAEWRKSLKFTGLEGLSIGVNLTYVKSKVNIQKDLQEIRNQKTRPMVGQAPYVVNTFFTYKNKIHKFDANIGFNISGKKLLIITERSTPYIYELPESSLNFNFGKEISKHWLLDFSADNILNSEYRAVYNYPEYIDNIRYSKGRNFTIGFKYKF